MLKRIVVTSALVAFFILAYFGVAGWLPDDAGRSLEIPIDTWIPFVPSAVLVYASVYVGVLLPMFTVPSLALFMRVACAYGVVIASCAICFAVFPVSASSLRPPLGPLEDPGFIDWGIRLLYTLDPPVNLFPSLHVALACCAAMGTWMARRRLGFVVGLWAVSVAIATCLTKQHFVVDVVAGCGLGLFALWVATRGVDIRDADRVDDPGFVGLGWPLGIYIGMLLILFVWFEADAGSVGPSSRSWLWFVGVTGGSSSNHGRD